MADRRADIARNYHPRIRAIRSEVMRQLAAAYGRVTEDEIRSTYAAFVPRAARVIAAGQAASQTTTRAYIRGVGGFEPAPLPALAGTSKAGTMTDALKGIDLFVLGWIAKGSSAAGALTMGAGYVDRLADNELTRVVDAEVDGQAASSPRVTGWVGSTFGATDECTANEGSHSLDEDMVRHAHCQCVRSLLFQDMPESIQRAYDAGDVVLGRELNVAVGVARGGSLESGGAMR